MKTMMTILALALSTCAFAQQEIRLYDGVAPGSEGVQDNERITRGPDGNIQNISGVVTPSITVYLPDADKATGTAVILCSGGGLMAHSWGTDVINMSRWLNERGIAAIGLKYRTRVMGGGPGGPRMGGGGMALSASVTEFSKITKSNANPDTSESGVKNINNAINDALRAMEIVREHAAEWHINPDKIGFLVGTSSNLSIANNEYDLQVDGITSSFSKSVTGLKQLTTYYYRAYALFEDKYYYGDAKSFTTEKEKEALAKISLVSRNGTSLKVKYEISSEVDYYYCGKGTSISQTTKYTAEKTLTYSELKPGQDYTFTVIAYTKDGKKNDPVRATFSTSTSPYTNYLCIDGDFYPFTGVTMTTDYDYTAVNGTGTNWKILYLYLSGDEFVQFRYGVHQWESVTTSWSSGTYKITDSSSYYSYNGWFYNGSRADWFYEGNLKIQKSGSSYVFDFECEGNKKYFGHVEANS